VSGTRSGVSNVALTRTQADTAPMPVIIVGWRPIGKGAIIGSADITLGKLSANGLLVLRGTNGRVWVNFPGIPMIGSNDLVLRDANGKVRYTAVFKWADTATRDRFSDSVIGAIRAQYGDSAVPAEGGQ
jgi:hypothetical protein